MIFPGRFRLLAAVLILLTAAVSLYARGAKEDSTLSRADELIAQKEYDQAIQLLSDFAKDNPDRFDDAQKRLRKIVGLRERYNEVANELLDMVENDPENSVKILELSNILLSIESPSNPATRHFLDQIRFLAEFNVNRRRLEKILLDARNLLAANNFSGAMDTYASGLDIYQDAYFSSGYGEDAEDTASQGLELIRDNILEFNNLIGPFSRTAQAIASYCRSETCNPAGVSLVYNNLLPYAVHIQSLSRGFFNTRTSYDTQLAVLQKEQDVQGDRNFLSFAGRLITGPAGLNEGMTGTLDQFWYYWLNPAFTSLTGCVNDSYGAGLAAMINRDYAEGLVLFRDSGQYIATALEFVRNWNSFLETTDAPQYLIYGEMITQEMIGNFLKFQAMDRSLVYLTEAGNIGTKSTGLEGLNIPAPYAWEQDLLTATAAISQEEKIRGTYQDLVDELVILEEKIAPEIENIRFYQNDFSDVPGGVGTPQSYLTDTRNLVTGMHSRYQGLQYNSVVRLYTIANGDLEKRVIEREKEFNEGNSLIQGVSQERQDVGVYTAYYPNEGLAVLTRMNQSLGADISSARALISRYEAENRNLLNDAGINAFYVTAQNYLSRLLGLQSRSAGIMAGARTQIERAASLRYEGDRLFQAAQSSLNRNDIQGARSNLERATDQYIASLAVQESESLRSTWDTQRERLAANIDRIENELVIRDVRDLLNTAQASYFAGNMEQAESALINAQYRWRTTHGTEEQPEVENWLTLVRGAMSIQSARTIPATAPLYAEMSQLLSDALRNYNEGVRLLSGGRRTEGLARFKEAQDKTREVRLIFPLNYDARILELRIEQQTDPIAFNANFQRRLNEAVAGTKTRVAQSYAELLALADINPQYPGLQGILRQARYDMGLERPPPDPRDIARSTELTNNARGVVNNRDSIRYEAARTWLTQAITLNPGNTEAPRLLDQLDRLRGATTTSLPLWAREQYNNAVQEYQRGNYLIASSIVERLLQNTDFQRSYELQDLKRRLDAVQ